MTTTNRPATILAGAYRLCTDPECSSRGLAGHYHPAAARRWADRRERLAAHRKMRSLLNASSVGPSAWVTCEVHGRAARDPDTDRCVRCG